MHKLTDLKRGITVNVGLVKGGQSVNTTAPHAEGPDRPALRQAGAARLGAGGPAEDRRHRHGPRHDRQARDQGRVPARLGRRPRPRSCSAATRRRPPMPACRSPASSRAAAPIRASRRRSAVRPCAASGRSAPTRTRPRNTSRSRPWCRAPRPWRSPSCGCLPSAERRVRALRPARADVPGLDRRAAPPIGSQCQRARPTRGGPASIMTQLEEAGISPIAVNARPARRPNPRGCAAIEEFDKASGESLAFVGSRIARWRSIRWGALHGQARSGARIVRDRRSAASDARAAHHLASASRR